MQDAVCSCTVDVQHFFSQPVWLTAPLTNGRLICFILLYITKADRCFAHRSAQLFYAAPPDKQGCFFVWI